MTFRIKNWEKLQHFKDRNPPWIKLYRDILDDPDWHELDGSSAKVLINLWLIASEDKTKTGALPSERILAFRLRIKESQVKQELTKLSHWLIHDDINLISERYQVDAPETETERERETEAEAPAFISFWEAYPRKVSKSDAQKSWKKIKPKDYEKIMESLDCFKTSSDWTAEGGRFIPYPASWLNSKRFNDPIPEQQQKKVAW